MKYEVVHHTQFINELIDSGKLKLDTQKLTTAVFHDPCYLGRHNGEYNAPRHIMESVGVLLKEMPRTKNKSFCCGAGGAQMWKEEEHGDEAMYLNRYNEAQQTGVEVLAVGCPFCFQMMNDANNASGEAMQIRDVAEIVAESLV